MGWLASYTRHELQPMRANKMLQEAALLPGGPFSCQSQKQLAVCIHLNFVTPVDNFVPKADNATNEQEKAQWI